MTGTLIRSPLWTSTVWAIRTLSYLATGRSLRQHRRHGHSILPSHPAGAGGFGQRLGQRFPGHGDLQRLAAGDQGGGRSEEHTSELQSLMRISYAVFCLKKKNKHQTLKNTLHNPTTY